MPETTYSCHDGAIPARGVQYREPMQPAVVSYTARARGRLSYWLSEARAQHQRPNAVSRITCLYIVQTGSGKQEPSIVPSRIPHRYDAWICMSVPSMELRIVQETKTSTFAALCAQQTIAAFEIILAHSCRIPTDHQSVSRTDSVQCKRNVAHLQHRD